MLAKEINSLQHPIVKHLFKLRKVRKYRYAEGQVVIAGNKLVSEVSPLEILFVRKNSPIPETLQAKECFFVTEAILKKVSGLETPESIAALVKMPPWDPLKGKKWVLGLDSISDPGNLGTLLRTALALGWEGAYLTTGSADPFNEKAIRAAKGASFRLPLRLGSPEELLQWIKQEEMHVLVADMQGKPLNDWALSPKTLLILGSEALGISEMFKEQFEKICIPIVQMESLNVAAAGAIIMHHLKKQ